MVSNMSVIDRIVHQGATMWWKTSIGAFVLTLMLESPAPPGAWAGVPTDQLRGFVDKVLKLVGDPAAKREPLRERRASLRRIADDIFDWEETAKRSLGTHWQQRTSAEREEFVGLFADLLDRSYMSKIELYDGEKIGYVGDTIDGDQAIVRTKLVKQGSEMGVNYKMLRRDGERWKVYDVEIEGVSLIANYRTQFNNLLRRSSYPEVVRVLKAKVAAEPETETAAMASPRTR
jgi:phospholipid transport system substrate-binding protein